jgi:hypothetical protein
MKYVISDRTNIFCFLFALFIIEFNKISINFIIIKKKSRIIEFERRRTHLERINNIAQLIKKSLK